MNDLNRQVVDGLQAGLLLADGGGRVLFANDGAARMLGRDLTGARLGADSFDDDLPILVAVVESYRRRGRPAAGGGELLVDTREDGPSFIWVTMTPAATGGGGTLIALTDVTQALTGSPAIRKVFSQVSHDLRSPLTSIVGAAELLLSGRMGALEAAQRRLIAIIEEGTQKMNAILARTKQDLARSDAAGGQGGE